MGITYFKRFRMEVDLDRLQLEPPDLPAGYRLVPWKESLLESHSEVKFKCFREEIDASVFPCLGEREGCRRLMYEISTRSNFVPGATWLIEHFPDEARRPEPCGTIQGLIDDFGIGAIQNVGITPGHRGLGLGSVLLYHGLEGFRMAGMRRVFLEVTAQNTGALRLYERLGFRTTKTVYKAADVATVE